MDKLQDDTCHPETFSWAPGDHGKASDLYLRVQNFSRRRLFRKSTPSLTRGKKQKRGMNKQAKTNKQTNKHSGWVTQKLVAHRTSLGDEVYGCKSGRVPAVLPPSSRGAEGTRGVFLIFFFFYLYYTPEINPRHQCKSHTLCHKHVAKVQVQNHLREKKAHQHDCLKSQATTAAEKVGGASRRWVHTWLWSCGAARGRRRRRCRRRSNMAALLFYKQVEEKTRVSTKHFEEGEFNQHSP